MARKAHNIHYIYKTTCNVTGKWYVGMHSTSNENDGYMGSGTVLRRSIRKYGVSEHTKEILEYCDSREKLILREIEIVTKELISDGLCINLKEGGNGGFRDEEHRKNFMECVKNTGPAVEKVKWLKENDENWRLYQSNQIKIGQQKANFNYNTFEGRTHSEETKKLMSETLKGKAVGEKNSQYGTCWITKDGVNKKVKKDELNDHLYDGWITGRK
jgi:hypothetical protein